MYALILIDPGDTAYNTTVVFPHKWIFDWIKAAEHLDFGSGSSLDYPVPAEAPGPARSVNITVGSPDNDAAQFAMDWFEMLQNDQVLQPDLDALDFTESDFENEDEDPDDIYDEKARAFAAVRGVPPESIYVGMYY